MFFYWIDFKANFPKYTTTKFSNIIQIFRCKLLEMLLEVSFQITYLNTNDVVTMIRARANHLLIFSFFHNLSNPSTFSIFQTDIGGTYLSFSPSKSDYYQNSGSPAHSAEWLCIDNKIPQLLHFITDGRHRAGSTYMV